MVNRITSGLIGMEEFSYANPEIKTLVQSHDSFEALLMGIWGHFRKLRYLKLLDCDTEEAKTLNPLCSTETGSKAADIGLYVPSITQFRVES